MYKANEILANKYYQVPQELFTSKLYKEKLNSDSKILYALLLDRLTLSQKNNWHDEHGNVYLIFTRQEVQEKLCLSEKTVQKAFKQLSESNLILEKRQGLGRPNLIFIGKIIHEEIGSTLDTENVQVQTSKIYGSGTVESTVLEQEIFPAIKPNIINTDISNLTQPNQYMTQEGEDRLYEELFKNNIEYEYLLKHTKENDIKLVQSIVNVAVEAITSKHEQIYVNSKLTNKEIIKAGMLKLNISHIQYVVDYLKDCKKEVRKEKPYVLTVLYNSIDNLEFKTTIAVANMMNE